MIKLNLQMFGGGSSGAGGDGLSASQTTSKYSFGGEPGSRRGSGGGIRQNSSRREEDDERNTLKVPYSSGERYSTTPVEKIEKGESYFIRQFRSNGETRNYGILPAEDVRELLRGYKYDEKYGMWFTSAANRGFTIYRIIRRK